MQNTTPSLAAAALLLMAVPASAQNVTSPAPPPAQTAQQFHFTQTTSATVNYLLYLPNPA